MATELWFHERMEGFFGIGDSNPEVGQQKGEKAKTTFGFELTIQTADLDRFIADPRHTCNVFGEYVGNASDEIFPGLKPGEQPRLVAGSFNFMSTGAGKQKLMEHHHTLTAAGKTYRFDGYKYIEDDPFTWDAWADLTTLYCTIRDDQGRPVAAGVTRFLAKDTPKLIASFGVRGTNDPLKAKLAFFELFLGNEFEALLAPFLPFDKSGRRRVLSIPRKDMANEYDVVIVGSGYGGGAVASRLSEAVKSGAKKVCILERGTEWRAGDFPDDALDLPWAVRSKNNPLGLIDYRFGETMDVVVGNGLGGTSLINASTMIRPDKAVFDLPDWPKLPDLDAHYDSAEKALHVAPHPSAPLKSVVFQKACSQTGVASSLAKLAVTFEQAHREEGDIVQQACVGCGGCVSGCNYNAKNTVDMTYLAAAQLAGVHIVVCADVDTVEKTGAGFVVHCRDLSNPAREAFDVKAKRVVLAAGTLGSFGILARSAEKKSIQVDGPLGDRFSGNGDVLGFGYNTHDVTQIGSGPTITTVARFDDHQPDIRDRFIIEEGGIPQPLKPAVRSLIPFLRPEVPDPDDGPIGEMVEWLRTKADLVGLESLGAMNRTVLFFGMGFEEKLGKLVWKDDKVSIDWPDPTNEQFARRIDKKMAELTMKLGGAYIENPRSRSLFGKNLVTAHPLGGCPMGATSKEGVVDAKGEVFGTPGLYVADGSILPTPLGVNPALTIAALAEHIGEGIAKLL